MCVRVVPVLCRKYGFTYAGGGGGGGSGQPCDHLMMSDVTLMACTQPVKGSLRPSKWELNALTVNHF